MNSDTAFFDRIHYYLPGWEVPKFRPEHFTDRYGFIVDYIAEFFREMRKRPYSDHITRFFRLGNNLNQRDVVAVKKTFSGLMKLSFTLTRILLKKKLRRFRICPYWKKTCKRAAQKDRRNRVLRCKLLIH